MTIKKLTLWFEKTDTKLEIPFTNEPIYEIQRDLVQQLIVKADRDRIDNQYTQPMKWWDRSHMELKIRVETTDEQLSWKNLSDETLTSIAEINIPYKNTACMFKGYLMDFEIGSYFKFHVTHTLHTTDKAIGFSVSENNILLWPESFPKELLEQL